MNDEFVQRERTLLRMLCAWLKLLSSAIGDMPHVEW